MDSRSNHARYHSLSTPSLPLPRPTNTSPPEPGRRRIESSHARYDAIRSGYGNDLRRSISQQSSPPGRSSETWLDFLAGEAGEDLQGNNGGPSSGQPPPAAAQNLPSHLGSRLIGDGSEVRKRRLTAPDSPTRRGGHGRPVSGHERTYATAQRPGNGGSGSTPQSTPVVDLTSPRRQDAPAQRPPPPPPYSGTDGASRHASSRSVNEVVLPPWQPDNEVTKCPVCQTQFSLFTRRHHCRKCGRVVCSRCSPHRITIPRQFIVHPPSPTSFSILDHSDNSDAEMDDSTASPDNPALGGGEQVRVCNPCVPDPNLNPPSRHQASTQPLAFQDLWANGHHSYQPHNPLSNPRLHEAGVGSNMIPRTSSRPNHRASYSTGGPFNNPHGTFAVAPPSHPSGAYEPWLGHQQGNNMAHTSSSSLPRVSGPDPSRTHRGYTDEYYTQRRYAPRSTFDHSRQPPFANLAQTGRPLPALPSSPHYISHLAPAADAPPPRPQIAEEDECPICAQELPPKGPDGSETDREAHVMECIASSFTPSSSIPATRASQPPQALPPLGSSLGAVQGATASSLPGMGGSGPLAGSPASGTAAAGPSRPRGATITRMLLYRATEKDAIGDDGEPQECIICFEEFEQGNEMGRLECLCKFHKGCIRSWWETKGHGSCPTHQLHD